jgi:hypothetical protein
MNITDVLRENHHESWNSPGSDDRSIKPVHRYFLRRRKAWQQLDHNLVNALFKNKSAFSSHSTREKGDRDQTTMQLKELTIQLMHSLANVICRSAWSVTAYNALR